MENYVLSSVGLNRAVGEAVNGEKAANSAEGLKDEECNCFLCQLRKAIESNP